MTSPAAQLLAQLPGARRGERAGTSTHLGARVGQETALQARDRLVRQAWTGLYGAGARAPPPGRDSKAAPLPPGAGYRLAGPPGPESEGTALVLRLVADAAGCRLDVVRAVGAALDRALLRRLTCAAARAEKEEEEKRRQRRRRQRRQRRPAATQ